MNKGVLWVFDLDQTIVESSCLEDYRSKKDWAFVRANMNLVEPFGKIVDFIKKRIGERNKGVYVSVVTSSPDWYAKKIIENLGIRIEDIILVAYNETTEHKPKPEPVLRAFEKCKGMAIEAGYRIAEINCVGDRRVDYLSAVEAEEVLRERDDLEQYDRVNTIFAGWGFPGANLKSWDAKYTIICKKEEELCERYNIYKSLLPYGDGEKQDFHVEKCEEYDFIYFLTCYYPVSGVHDDLSSLFFKAIKMNDDSRFYSAVRKNYMMLVKEAIDRLAKSKNVMKGKCGIFVVPSSKQDKWSDAIVDGLLPRLKKEGYIVCYESLRRKEKLEKKLAQGGDRSIENHLSSMEIDPMKTGDIDCAIVLDDVTTSGNSLAACDMILLDNLDLSMEGIFNIAFVKTERIDC